MYDTVFLYKASAATQLEVLSVISPHFELWCDISYFVVSEK